MMHMKMVALKKAYVFKPAAKSLQFLLDANEEKGLLKSSIKS